MLNRPSFHFTPPRGWMNDPNGAVYINGVYHLFYQYYPDGLIWGPMHWGHAVSRDLISWKHKPIALCPDELGYIFSGSCVFDTKNVSGLGTAEKLPLIAIYTNHNPQTGEQQQSIAYSLDFEHFTKYAGNPVIENRKESESYKADFRDPKIFLNPVKGGFSVVLAAGQKLEFYHSVDMLCWEKTGEFALEERGFDGICECPDCFPLETKEGVKWILSFSLISPEGHVMPYFIGEFDGDTFHAAEGGKEQLLLDYGMDNYAMVSFLHSEEHYLIGWGENWDYVAQTPATEYRGKMTLVRKPGLVEIAGRYRLRFEPVGKIEKKEYRLHVGDKLSFYNTYGERLVLKVTHKEVIVDRSKSGRMDFSECLQKPGYQMMRASRVTKGDCTILVIQEEGYFEIFAEDGLLAFSVMTYPQEALDKITITRA